MHSREDEGGTIQGQPEAKASFPDMKDETAPPSETESTGASKAEREVSGEQKMVPLAALHEERGRRQTLQKERELLKNKLELLKEIVKSQPYSKQEPENEDGEEGGALNPGQAERFFQDIYQSNMFPEVLALREEIARLKHPDYDEVITGFAGRLSADPDLQQAILSADDPAEAAYKIARQSAGVPGDGERPENKTVQRIERNINAPRTPASPGRGTSTGGVTAEKLLEMSHEDFSRVWDTMTPAQRRKLCQG